MVRGCRPRSSGHSVGNRGDQPCRAPRSERDGGDGADQEKRPPDGLALALGQAICQQEAEPGTECRPGTDEQGEFRQGNLDFSHSRDPLGSPETAARMESASCLLKFAERAGRLATALQSFVSRWITRQRRRCSPWTVVVCTESREDIVGTFDFLGRPVGNQEEFAVLHLGLVFCMTLFLGMPMLNSPAPRAASPPVKAAFSSARRST